MPLFPSLPEVAPPEVAADEYGSDEASDDSEEQEGDELEEDPGRVVLNEEEDRVLVAERVDGLQHEGGHQRAEERAPQRLQGEVVAHLERGEGVPGKVTDL